MLTGTMAGKVLWAATMSLDGFIAGPNDAMDWVFQHAGPNPVIDEVIRSTGAVLAGRRSYDVGERSQRPERKEAFGGGWSGPEFVLTHRPPADPFRPSMTFLSGDIRPAVATALGAAGGKDLHVIGANVARQCIDAGLIDEILVFVAPILLGEGVRFFDRAGGVPVALEKIRVTEAGEITTVRFRVLEPLESVLRSAR
jgi:dihydrofolate reductase